jgi:hypothetical protein
MTFRALVNVTGICFITYFSNIAVSNSSEVHQSVLKPVFSINECTDAWMKNAIDYFNPNWKLPVFIEMVNSAGLLVFF